MNVQLLQPVKTVRSYQQIVAQLEALIASGQLQIGDRLPGERELTEQFKVSRVVVREALRDLEARGIVETRQGSGTYVQTVSSPDLARSLTLLTTLDKAELIDMMVVRKGLEAITTPLAVKHGTAEQFQALRQSIGTMSAIMDRWLESEDSFYAYSKEDINFHLLIAEAAHNRPAHTILSAVLPLIKTSRVELFKRAGSFGRFRSEYARQVSQHTEHINIANAILNLEVEIATDFMMAHLDRVIELFRNIDQP